MSESRCDMAPLFSPESSGNFIISPVRLRFCPSQAAVLAVLRWGVCRDPRPVHEDERLPQPLLGLGRRGRRHRRQVRTRRPLNPLKSLFSHWLRFIFTQLIFSHACRVATSILLFILFFFFLPLTLTLCRNFSPIMSAWHRCGFAPCRLSEYVDVDQLAAHYRFFRLISSHLCPPFSSLWLLFFLPSVIVFGTAGSEWKALKCSFLPTFYVAFCECAT